VGCKRNACRSIPWNVEW